MSITGLALAAVMLLFGVVALIRSFSAEDRGNAVRERLLGGLLVVSGLVTLGLAFAAA